MYFVYILQSLKDKKHYIGFTNNIEVRLSSHNNGLVKSTKYRKPFTIVYKESFKTKKHAQLRENELKKMKGGIQFKSLIVSRE